ncbi:MAG: OmpH family outer membrane protein [Candidatus Omnitrophica bacterium]|nr:OmpH family outer membrane protein [Candidatus Omnitrophota bacterium]
MKKLVFVFGLVIFLLGRTSFVNAVEKLAYVDLSRIFSEYNKTKDYDKVLTDKQNVYEGERDKKVSEVKQLQDKMNLLSDKEKEKKKEELEEKIKALQEYDRQKTTDLRKEQDEKMKEILKDIEEAVRKYAEQEGYSLVFNDRVLVYQSKSLDITDKIIDILNKQYKK